MFTFDNWYYVSTFILILGAVYTFLEIKKKRANKTIFSSIFIGIVGAIFLIVCLVFSNIGFILHEARISKGGDGIIESPYALFFNGSVFFTFLYIVLVLWVIFKRENIFINKLILFFLILTGIGNIYRNYIVYLSS